MRPDADTLLVTYGSPSNSAFEVVSQRGDVGLFRLITLWPFPEEEFRRAAANARRLLVMEMNLGQLFWEVERIARQAGCRNIELFSKIGGDVHTPDEIIERLKR
jgi:2-oxoglutarate ferredoxin oxidoreductase subunit alpha